MAAMEAITKTTINTMVAWEVMGGGDVHSNMRERRRRRRRRRRWLWWRR